MSGLPAFTGLDALQTVNRVSPMYVLDFYPQAVIMRRFLENGGVSEYPIDPSQLAQVLAAKVEFASGLINPDVIYVAQSGVERIVAAYRKPQITGIWLEGSEAPVRLPLPGLIMVRRSSGGGGASYAMFAVRGGRPRSLKVKLYEAPLPNVGGGGMCWGTVMQPSPEQLKQTNLDADWQSFLGSRFGNHSVGNKSKKHKGDLRKLYMEIEGQEKYPTNDLVDSSRKLVDVLKGRD